MKIAACAANLLSLVLAFMQETFVLKSAAKMNKTTTKKTLIIMAHGSRKVDANTEFTQLAKQIDFKTLGYTRIRPCFLELAEPSLLDVIGEEADQEHHCFDLYPLFFNQGNHVMRDIPKQIAAAIAQHPKCEIQLLNYFGSSSLLAGSIAAHIEQQQNL